VWSCAILAQMTILTAVEAFPGFLVLSWNEGWTRWSYCVDFVNFNRTSFCVISAMASSRVGSEG
jgi:hypothetical protein